MRANYITITLNDDEIEDFDPTMESIAVYSQDPKHQSLDHVLKIETDAISENQVTYVYGLIKVITPTKIIIESTIEDIDLTKQITVEREPIEI